MMWVFFVISLIELFVVHLFVALKWPMIGWTLTTISAIGAIWLLFWIRSFRTRPHALNDGKIELNFGSLKKIALDFDQIERVSRGWESGAVQAKNAVNLAGLAYPNRCIELKEALEKGRERVFIRLDEPEGFDEALSERGISFA